MRQAILNFPKQLEWEPKIENEDHLPKVRHFIVAGMGGSHLAADLLELWNPDLHLIIHKDYGLPRIPEHYREDVLVIASSYSGNTEETLDAYHEAKRRNLPVAAISTGGQLIEISVRDRVPYVLLPDTDIQPRAALGFSLKALLKLMGQERALKELSGLSRSLQVLGAEAFEDEGKRIAESMAGRIPVIYSSQRNYPIAYNWKIKFNETGKIPAFCNFFPELNHNEMTGFDFTEASRQLSDKFSFIFLQDEEDDLRIQKRMEVLGNILRRRGFLVVARELQGVNVFHKIFASLLLADWAAYHTALQYGADPEQVPLVEEFKKLIQ